MIEVKIDKENSVAYVILKDLKDVIFWAENCPKDILEIQYAAYVGDKCVIIYRILDLTKFMNEIDKLDFRSDNKDGKEK